MVCQHGICLSLDSSVSHGSDQLAASAHPTTILSCYFKSSTRTIDTIYFYRCSHSSPHWASASSSLPLQSLFAFFFSLTLRPPQSRMAGESLRQWLMHTRDTQTQTHGLRLECTASGGFAAQVGAEQEHQPSFDDLPYEIRLAILERLDPSSILAASQTCRSWRMVASDRLLVSGGYGKERTMLERAGDHDRKKQCFVDDKQQMHLDRSYIHAFHSFHPPTAVACHS